MTQAAAKPKFPETRPVQACLPFRMRGAAAGRDARIWSTVCQIVTQPDSQACHGGPAATLPTLRPRVSGALKILLLQQHQGFVSCWAARTPAPLRRQTPPKGPPTPLFGRGPQDLPGPLLHLSGRPVRGTDPVACRSRGRSPGRTSHQRGSAARFGPEHVAKAAMHGVLV